MVSIVFQFHKGAIRTRFSNLPLDYFKFQFHKGAIRTRRGCIAYGIHPNFNSIKVRLEPCPIGLNDFTTQISIP